MLYKMIVKGLTLDPLTNMPILILKDIGQERALPIWVGVAEANAILLELEKVYSPRPMTHDLLKNVIETLNGQVLRIVVNDLRDSTYYAVIDILHEGQTLSIDARPSDAIALALRTNAPIYVSDTVVAKAKSIDLSKSLDDSEQLKEWLDKLTPDDFGKYEM